MAKAIRPFTHRRVFLGTELHINRTLHLHGLLQLPTKDPAFQRPIVGDIWGCLYDRFGRSQVSQVQSNEAVSIYVTKYCVKDLTSWTML